MSLFECDIFSEFIVFFFFKKGQVYALVGGDSSILKPHFVILENHPHCRQDTVWSRVYCMEPS